MPASAERVDARARSSRRWSGWPGAGRVVLASGDPGFFGIVRLLRERGHEPAVLPARSSVAAAVRAARTLLGRRGRGQRARAGPGAGGERLPGAAGRRRAHRTGRRAGRDRRRAGRAGRARWSSPRTSVGRPSGSTRCPRPRLPAATGTRSPSCCASATRRRCRARGWSRRWRAGRRRPVGGRCPTTRSSTAPAWSRRPRCGRSRWPGSPRAPGTLVWDVGAGSGSVAVECARLGAAALAVERRADDAVRIARQRGRPRRRRPGRARVRRRPRWPGCPRPDAVFVGGGGPEVVAAAAAAGPDRIVVALAALDRIAPTRAALQRRRLRRRRRAARGVPVRRRCPTVPSGSLPPTRSRSSGENETDDRPVRRHRRRAAGRGRGRRPPSTPACTTLDELPEAVARAGRRGVLPGHRAPPCG